MKPQQDAHEHEPQPTAVNTGRGGNRLLKSYIT